MKVPLTEIRIAGALRAARGKAAFVRPRIVVALGDGQLAEARRIPLTDPLEVLLLGPEDWRALLDGGEALELPTQVPARVGVALWMLRASFPAARTSAEQLGTAVVGSASVEGTQVLCVAETPEAQFKRYEWADAAYNRARSALREGRFHDALEDAELVVDLRPGIEEGAWALAIVALECAGDQARADGYLALVENSESAAARARVAARCDELRRELDRPRRQSPRAYLHRAKLRREGMVPREAA